MQNNTDNYQAQQANVNIIRTNKEKNDDSIPVEKFTRIDNGFLKRNDLSAKAKGIFSYILSLPDNWIFFETELVKHFSDSTTSFRSGMLELLKKGYITKKKKRGKNGLFLYNEYKIYEKPELNPNYAPPIYENQHEPLVGFPQWINVGGLSTVDEPTMDKPTMDNPTMDNHSILTTNDTNNESTNNLHNKQLNQQTTKETNNKEKANALSCHSHYTFSFPQEDQDEMLAYHINDNNAIENQSYSNSIIENPNNINILFEDSSRNASDYNNSIENYNTDIEKQSNPSRIQKDFKNSQTNTNINAQFSKSAKKAKSKYAYDFNENLIKIESINEIFKNDDNYIFSSDDIQKIKIYFEIFQNSFKVTNMSVEEWFFHSKNFCKKNWIKAISNIIHDSMVGIVGEYMPYFFEEGMEKIIFQSWSNLSVSEKNLAIEKMRGKNKKFAFSKMGFAYVVQEKYRYIANLPKLIWIQEKGRYYFPGTDTPSNGFEIEYINLEAESIRQAKKWSLED